MLIQEGAIRGTLADKFLYGMIWYKDSRPWGKVIFQERIDDEWQDIDIVFQNKIQWERIDETKSDPVV